MNLRRFSEGLKNTGKRIQLGPNKYLHLFNWHIRHFQKVSNSKNEQEIKGVPESVKAIKHGIQIGRG